MESYNRKKNSKSKTSKFESPRYVLASLCFSTLCGTNFPFVRWKDVGASAIGVMEGNRSQNPPGMRITREGYGYTRDLYFPPEGIHPRTSHQAIRWISTLRNLQKCQTKKTTVAKRLDRTWWGLHYLIYPVFINRISCRMKTWTTSRDVELPCSRLGLLPLILSLARCHPLGLLLLTLLLVPHPHPLPWILTGSSPSMALRKTCYSGKIFRSLTFPDCATRFGLSRQSRLRPSLLSLIPRSLRNFSDLKNTNLYPQTTLL